MLVSDYCQDRCEVISVFPKNPILLLVHSDPWIRRELAEEIEVWSSGDLDVVAVGSENEAHAAISGQLDVSDRLAIVIADEKLSDDDGRNFLLGIRKHYPAASLAILRVQDESADDGVLHIPSSPNAVGRSIKPLRLSWRPTNPQLQVKGPEGTREADILKDFFWRTSTTFNWTPEGDVITVTIDGKEHASPTLEELFKHLKIFREPQHPLEHKYDLVIVGAGPAGLSAALNASINVGLSTLIVESNIPGGTATTSINLIDNYLGFPRGVSGTRLAKLALQQAETLELVDFRPTLMANYLKRDTHGRYLIGVVNSSNEPRGEVSGAMVLLACGSKPHTLRLATDHLPARGVYYSALPCDQIRERGKNVVIVGGGNSAAQAALQFAEESKVTMVAVEGLNRMTPNLQKAITEDWRIEVLPTHKVAEFVGDEQLTEVRIKENGDRSRKLLTRTASSAYILIGGEPDTKWLHPDTRGLARGEETIERNRYGYIKTDHHLRRHRGKLPFETNLPGVFAAGDVRVNSLRRVGQAVGQGAAAVASMELYAAENSRILRDEASPAYRRFQILGLTGS